MVSHRRHTFFFFSFSLSLRHQRQARQENREETQGATRCMERFPRHGPCPQAVET